MKRNLACLYAIYDKESMLYSVPNCLQNDDLAMRWFFGVLDGLPDYVRCSLRLVRICGYDSENGVVDASIFGDIVDGIGYDDYMKHRRPAPKNEEN